MKLLKLAVAAVAMSGFAVAANAQTIKIGVAGPMTGQYAAFGEQLKRGAEMAVKDINAAGGVMGKKLELLIGDDACDPKQATAVANKMATDKIVFMAGHFCSGSTGPAQPIYRDAKILHITPASTRIDLTENKIATFFRTCGRDDIQGNTVAQYILKNYKGKNVAVLHDKSPYGKGVADVTKGAIEKGGLKPVMYEAYNDQDKDFAALISKMKQAKIDVIVLGGYHTAGAYIIRQSREQGLKAQLIGFDALVTNEFGTIAGDASDGVLMTDSPDQRKLPSASKVVAAFTADKYDPEGYTLRSYAAVQVWAEAVKKAGTTDAAKVAATLRANTFKTIVGDLAFDAKGDIKKPEYAFYAWKGGKYAQVP